MKEIDEVKILFEIEMSNHNDIAPKNRALFFSYSFKVKIGHHFISMVTIEIIHKIKS
jgi:hypothetical protein